MRNLQRSGLVSYDFHNKVIDSKHNPREDALYKNRLTAMSLNIEQLFNEYQNHFDVNTLEVIPPNRYLGQDRTDLLSLYRYKSKLIQNLKTEVTTTETNRIISTCQNCTVNAVNSFDHILPKEEFSEFVVNPLNLFPSCTECNSYKGGLWHLNGEKIFLNLYLDTMPQVQYLFVDVSYENDTFRTRFYLDNRNQINAQLYRLIESHYTRLHLCKRFESNNDLVITPLINEIKPYLALLRMPEIIRLTIEGQNANRQSLGFNYWQSILTIALIQNDDFINYLHR